MKTVFVLISDMGYDGQSLMGVYSSYDGAKEAWENYKEKHSSMSMLIEERELDAKGYIQY